MDGPRWRPLNGAIIGTDGKSNAHSCAAWEELGHMKHIVEVTNAAKKAGVWTLFTDLGAL